MTRHAFSAKLVKDGGAFEVPLDVRALFGSARPAVKMTIGGETFRTRVMVYGGKYMLGIWKAVAVRMGLAAGQTIDVVLEPDDEQRTVEPPAELASALHKSAAARAGWAKLSFTHRREWAEAIAGAKRPETRARRVAQAIEALVAKTKPAKRPAARRRRAG